jgi:hypothetical protein
LGGVLDFPNQSVRILGFDLVHIRTTTRLIGLPFAIFDDDGCQGNGATPGEPRGRERATVTQGEEWIAVPRSGQRRGVRKGGKLVQGC